MDKGGPSHDTYDILPGRVKGMRAKGDDILTIAEHRWSLNRSSRIGKMIPMRFSAVMWLNDRAR